MAGNLSDSMMSLPTDDLPSWRDPTSNSDHTSSTTAMNRERLRLASEVQRDFNDMSFSDVAPPGAADYSDTTTFDVGKDAAATSTRQYDTPPQYNGKPIFAYPQQNTTSGQMLFPQTPTINSQVLREQFADFSMAGKGQRTMAITSDEDTGEVPYEMGRGPKGYGRQRGDSLFDNTSEFMSMNNGRKSNTRQPSGGAQQNQSQKRRVKPQERSFGSPVQKSGFQTLNFDPTTTTPKRTRSRLSPRPDEHPSKIMDFVSSVGSGGSRGRFAKQVPRARDSEEDALSDVGSVVRPRSRFQGRQSTGNIPEEPKMRKASGNVPKGFKSTGDFLKELGLDNRHTDTLNLQAELRELKNPGPIRNPKTRQQMQRQTTVRANPVQVGEPSFIIPPMPDMTELFSGNEPTRFSMKNGAAAESHVPIDSIPIPVEARAMLTAMRLLQEKVEKLENTKAKNQQKCAKLESELRKAEQRYQQEMRTRLAEADARRRRTGADSTFGGSEDGDAEERQKEKARIELMMEKLRMFSSSWGSNLVLIV